jgi:hypothetical protein
MKKLKAENKSKSVPNEPFLTKKLEKKVPGVSVRLFCENQSILIVLKKRDNYDSQIPLTYNFLAYVSEIFETKNINIGKQEFYDECPTCDFGIFETILYVNDSPLIIEEVSTNEN